MNHELKIIDMTQPEMTEMIEICSAMFQPSKLSDSSITAFTWMLKNKFHLMTCGTVMKLCTDVAANPHKADLKFSPTFLASILQLRMKPAELTHHERELTQEERAKFRQEFLKDLYADFDDFSHGVAMTRIYVWQYVAELMIRCGFAECLPMISEERGRYAGAKDILSAYKPFVEDCFRRIISGDKHVSDYIHGYEN